MAPEADINMNGSTARTSREEYLDNKSAMEKIDDCSSTSGTVDPIDQIDINEKSDVLRGSYNNSMSSSFPQLDASSPIKDFDLDFDTAIPPTSHQSSLKEDCSSPPPQPDLKKFASPFHWSKTRKNLTMVLCCSATMVSAYSAGSFSPASAAMMANWNVSAMYVSFGITAFCLGFAVMPMVLAPFSELRGRYPVFWICGLLFTGSQIGCALVQTYHGMIIFRFLVGCSSSVFASVVGGVISDLYHAKDRNAPMAVYSGSALLATGLGPFISGPMVERVGWRWLFWLQVIMDGLVALSFLLFFKETRGSVLLTRKAAALNMWYEERERAGYYGVDVVLEDGSLGIERVRWTVKADKERESLYTLLQTSVTRPFKLLFREPVVFFFSLWVSFCWGVLYLTFGAVPLVLSRTYNFSIAQCSLTFLSLCLGATLATILSIFQEAQISRLVSKILPHPSAHNSRLAAMGLLNPNTAHQPEQRLHFALVYSPCLPIGLFLFGTTAKPEIHWIVPAIAIGFASVGIYAIYLATFNYLADVYHRYASSALAAQSFCRNVMAGMFPIVTVMMFENLGFEVAGCLLGGIAVILTIVPWVLVFKGPMIRARSPFAREIM